MREHMKWNRMKHKDMEQADVTWLQNPQVLDHWPVSHLHSTHNPNPKPYPKSPKTHRINPTAKPENPERTTDSHTHPHWNWERSDSHTHPHWKESSTPIHPNNTHFNICIATTFHDIRIMSYDILFVQNHTFVQLIMLHDDSGTVLCMQIAENT